MIAFIPARGGSKGIPNKNMKLLGGKPLVVWSIETALACGLRTIVSTDSDTIGVAAIKAGAEVLMRPASLSGDETSMLEVLQSEIPKIKPVPDTVLLLQPTAPFRTNTEIAEMLRALELSVEEYTSVISVEEVPEKWNPAQVIVEGPDGCTMADGRSVSARITRRQDFPKAWTPTGSAYLFRTKNLALGSIYGTNVGLYKSHPTININTPEDFLEAELWLQKSSQK